MTNILILGANGQLARSTTRVLIRDTDAKLTLYLRRAQRLTNPDPSRVTIVESELGPEGSSTAAYAPGGLRVDFQTFPGTPPDPHARSIGPSFGCECHLIRLMCIGLEILEAVALRVRRDGAAELAAIRDGAVSFDGLLVAASQVQESMQRAAAATLKRTTEPASHQGTG